MREVRAGSMEVERDEAMVAVKVAAEKKGAAMVEGKDAATAAVDWEKQTAAAETAVGKGAAMGLQRAGEVGREAANSDWRAHTRGTSSSTCMPQSPS